MALGGSWEGLGGLLEASKRHLGPKTVRARIFCRFFKKIGNFLEAFKRHLEPKTVRARILDDF